MSLSEYFAKRDIRQSGEPDGGQPGEGLPRFVIQKHRASQLHYDFRLEMDGILKSWAVPKGPSTDPEVKRLAVMVEDHPLDYSTFEGTIPDGQYGAGTVMVWDAGTYTDYAESKKPADVQKHIKAGLDKGDLKFKLHGQKLNGAFVLVRLPDADGQWLLIKKKDQYATTDDVAMLDRSSLSGRTMDEISQGVAPEVNEDLKDAPKATQPDYVEPMLSTLSREPFDDPDWIYEVKWDGYRIVAHLEGGEVKLWSRGRKDYTSVFAPVAEELARLKLNGILDGEMVVLDDQGRAKFEELQNYQSTGRGHLVYYVFDIPYVSGLDLTRLPLLRRKAVASQLIRGLKSVRFSDHVEGRGRDFYKAAKDQNIEGIVAKSASSPYQAGKRSRYWLKVRNQMRQEAVIGGYTDPQGSRAGIGALVLGVYEKGQLHYIGHAGSGLSSRAIHRLLAKLNPLERKTSPFEEVPETNAPVHWVAPRLVAEVKFSEWTDDDLMRHPTFLGLREDKDPKLVVKEVPSDATGNEPDAKVVLSHTDKMFWPELGYTKGMLADYYDRMAEVILPHLKDRPESLNRYPHGPLGSSFFQKNLEVHPDWVRTVPIYSESNDKDISWLITNDKESLLYMVNLGCIELNPWLSRVTELDYPDFCLIDLDAKTGTFDNVIKSAQCTHQVLEHAGVPSYVKTSGKTGLHIGIPLGGRYTFEQSRKFAELLTDLVQRLIPDITSVDRVPGKRKGLIYLDYLQNRKGQTMAAPYCVRPVPEAAVSTPLYWSEVRSGLDPKKFTMANIETRVDKVGDLWAGALGDGIDMGAVLQRLSGEVFSGPN